MKQRTIQDCDITKKLRKNHIHVTSTKYGVDFKGDFVNYRKDDNSTTLFLDSGSLILPLNHLQDYVIKAIKEPSYEKTIYLKLDVVTQNFKKSLQDLTLNLNKGFNNLSVKKVGLGYSAKEISEFIERFEEIASKICEKIEIENKVDTKNAIELIAKLNIESRSRRNLLNSYPIEEVDSLILQTINQLNNLIKESDNSYTDILFFAIDD